MIAEQVDQAIGGYDPGNKQWNHIRLANQINDRSVVESHIHGKRVADQQHKHTGNQSNTQGEHDIVAHPFIREQQLIAAQIIPTFTVPQTHDQRLHNRNNNYE
ncbi:hypothetical protein D1872_250550 [compost metagenome]